MHASTNMGLHGNKDIQFVIGDVRTLRVKLESEVKVKGEV